MSDSLVAFLHSGRTWDKQVGRWVVDTPVSRLLTEIEALAQVHGFTLSRWQSSKAKWIVKITYALHVGSRTMHFRHMGHRRLYYIVLDNREGKTQRCQAYRKLSTVLSYLHSLSQEATQ